MPAAKKKRARKPSKKTAADVNAHEEASLSPENPPDAPPLRLPTSGPALPTGQLAPNIYTAQLDIVRRELEQAQAEESMLRDRDEFFRLQNEVNQIRSRQQTVPQAHTLPLIQQPISPLPQQGTHTLTENAAIERKSFLHQGSDPIFAPLLHRFQAVDIKYIKQIYYGTFNVKHLNKLSNSFVNRLAGDDEEAKDLRDILRCFEVYGQIICFFAHETVRSTLQKALSFYRCHIFDLTIIYNFPSRASLSRGLHIQSNSAWSEQCGGMAYF